MTLRGFFKLEGRASRSEYWVVIGTVIFIGVVAFALAEYGFEIPILSKESSTYSVSEAVLYFSISLSIVFAMLPVTLRRLHDRNRGLGWLVFYTIVGSLFDVVDVYSHPFLNLPSLNQDTVYAIYGIAGMTAVVSLIDLGFLRGTAGTNFYGPDTLMLSKTDLDVFR